MAETQRQNAKNTSKVPEFLKGQLEQAQGRLIQFEESAQKALHDLMQKGKESRKDLEVLVQKLSKDDRVADLRVRLNRLQKTGVHSAEEWRGRAESFRAEALERIVELQGKAVSFLGVATREQIEELHRELDRLARKLEKREKARRTRKSTKAEA
jgi:hypothetical protein